MIDSTFVFELILIKIKFNQFKMNLVVDFWRENFYYKRSEEKTKKQKTYEISPYQPTESQDNKTHFSSANLDKTKSLELLDKSEIEAEPQTIVKKRSKRKIQRVFYDPRFNSYPSAKPYYTNFFRLFKNSKKSPINTSTPTDFGSDKLTKISNLISQLQLANKSQKNETIKTNSTLNSLTNLSGTISNSKSSLNFDTISINSCLSFIDMIDTSKHLIETYSTIPNHLPNRTRTKIENRRTNVLTLYSEQNNEYSEPFDLIATESEKKKNQDDDSAYSSCYQSNMSSPRTNNVKVTSTEDEIVESFSSSCSSSAQFTNSEYESVKDVLVNNEKDLFKSTITAFDILTERCSELMELFETENSESKKALELKRRFDKYQKNKCQESQIIYSNKLSSFLKRNLSFDFYMKSSSLLSNSISLSPSSNLTSDRFNSIRNLIVKMSKNEKIIFGKNIQEFIKCTLGLKELNPFVLMSNTRQFMNGIKNYLLKNDSSNSELMSLLEKERTKLDPNEIINIDSLIEDCLQSIVLQPLKAKIYYLMVDWFITDSSMISVKHSMKFIADLSDDEACNYLNLDKQCLPNEECLKKVRNYYNRMQCEYAPFAKLKYVLIILDDLIQTISESADFELLDSRKLFCVLAYTFSKCRMYAIQIEIEYIWNLVNKNLLSCETFFYLTLISCVCQSLANINSQKHFEYESFLAEVFIESGHELKKSHIPLKIGVKCKDLTNLISSKFKIFNQNEYGLYLVRDTEFLLVKDDEKVFEIRSNRIKSRSKFYLLYKKKVSNILCSKFL